MVCIHCGEETHVTNSRHQVRSNQVWRRRQCWQCRAVFTTEEAPAYGAAWAVRSPLGDVRPFVRDKLFLSLHKSLEHRPTALSDAGALTDTVIKKLAALVTAGSLPSQSISDVAQVALHRFDKAASGHYQAYHHHR